MIDCEADRHNTMKYLRGLWRLSIENRLDSKPEISAGLVWQNCSWFSLTSTEGQGWWSVALINIAINWSLDTTLQDSELKAQRSGTCACERKGRRKASCYKINTSYCYAPLLHWGGGGWCNISHIKTDLEVNSVKVYAPSSGALDKQ